MSRLSDTAFEQLEHQLVTLELAPGTLLTEADLCESTGIGRTPVREAVQRLAESGLLRVLPRKGLMVTPVSRRRLLDLLAVRRPLEHLVVEQAARRADAMQRGGLLAIADQIEGAGRDIDLFFDLDRQLDGVLAAASGNEYAVRSLAPLMSQCRRFWWLSREHLSLSDASAAHAEMARKVAAGDGAGAVAASDVIIDALERLASGVDVLV